MVAYVAPSRAYPVFDSTDSRDTIYPSQSSADETGDDYDHTSSARSMSSVATSVDSQEPGDGVFKERFPTRTTSDISEAASTETTRANNAKAPAATPPPPIEKDDYFINGHYNAKNGFSTATTPKAYGPNGTMKRHPQVLMPDGSTSSSINGGLSTASTGPTTIDERSHPVSPSLHTTPNFTRPLRPSEDVNNGSKSQQHLPITRIDTNLTAHRSHSTPTISRQSSITSGRTMFPPPPKSTKQVMQPQPQHTTAKQGTVQQQQQYYQQQHLNIVPTISPRNQHYPDRWSSSSGHAQQAALLGNRTSISSQVSNTSTQRSIHRSSTTGHVTTHHRPSFSFSRRRSLAGQGVAPNSAQIDEASVSAQDIERLHELIKAQRESKKKRREFLEDERVLVGTKVSEGHVNFVTAYNMLTGIRVSVSRCNAKLNHELTDSDFTAKHKLAFDIGGNELTPSAKYDFKFKDYAPYVFRHLRELFRLDPADYLISLTSKYIVSELGSPGKSGSFFYFSRDYRFIIKTIHHSEHKMLRKILKDYYNHVKTNPNTLISQFYGLHRVKLPFGRKIHFIVMNNLFPPHRDIHKTYDLKGSTLGRFLPESPINQRRSVVYKDLNWIKHEEHLKLGPKKREEFIKQLELDVALLKKLNIMDYSLLIGIHDLNKGNSENIRDSTLSVFEPSGRAQQLANMSHSKVAELRKALNATSPTAISAIDFALDGYMQRDFKFYADSGGYRATDENDNELNEIYYLGVIDCLTPYTFSKRVETFWKSLSNNRPTISAVPATEYGDRFFSFIKSVISSSTPSSNRNNESEEASGTSTSYSNGRTEQQHHNEPPMHLPALTETSTEAPSI